MKLETEQKVNILRVSTAAIAILASTAACTTLGSNVSGDFSCKAPGGMCAPLPAIDDAALADMNVQTGPEAHVPDPQTPDRPVPDGLVARTGERILRIVIPSHVDRRGVLHEAAVLHKVVERQGWATDESGHAGGFRSRLADHLRAANLTVPSAETAVHGASSEASVSTSFSSAARITAPSPRAAVAGASAPEIGGGGQHPSPRSRPSAEPSLEHRISSTFPSASALAAAAPGAIRERRRADLANILRDALPADGLEDGDPIATRAPQNLLPRSLPALSLNDEQAEIVARKQAGFDAAKLAEAATRLDEMTDSVISDLEKPTRSDATGAMSPAFPRAPITGEPQ
ncbi:MAG: hypothetical protein WA906_03345 [Pacificimonas sp.]